jgi:excinuclease ABC subunit A
MSEFLEVYGAKTHNLKNIDVKIPKNKITVITGVSGSGKSSLAFNTIYSIGQQKYLESLSSYARMFIWGMQEEAEVWEIKGLSPTISIDQKTTSKNPRSTVWTITEIFDYYKLLYLNVWERRCSKCSTVVKKDSIGSIVNYLSTKELWSKFLIKAPIKENYDSFDLLKKDILESGFIRFSIWEDIYTVNDNVDIQDFSQVDIVIDRLVLKEYEDEDSPDTKRLKDSLELAFKEWGWILKITMLWDEEKQFSNVFMCSECGHVPEKLNISSFSFNSHQWACEACHGLWVKKVFLEENIINPRLTLLEWAVMAPWFGWDYFFSQIEKVAHENDICLNTVYSKLSEREKKIVLYWTGKKTYQVSYENDSWIKNTYKSRFEWVINTLERRYFDWGAEKGNYDDFIVDMSCNECDWKRLKKEVLSVFLNDVNIGDLANMSVDTALEFLGRLEFNASEAKIVKKVLKNAVERLEFLAGVWLNYMTISRKTGTLSGWEAQRIRLATQIGTKLEGIIYVLDEPSIWLHTRDNNMLIDNLKKLRDIGNTLIIVEHDEDIMKNADHIIDIWPWAWIHWWELISEWDINHILKDKKSVTWPYLSHTRQVLCKKWSRPSFKDLQKNNKVIQVIGAEENNLKKVDVTIPLANMVVVTWVSGSGKSSLVNEILSNYMANKLNRAKRTVWKVETITGLEHLDKAVIIDQSPIGKTPRSNPATYTGVLTHIRDVFSMTEEAKVRWYAPWRFSFNTRQWRCDVCDGDGVKKIEMHFLPPVYVECEWCKGRRYNKETLQIRYKGKTISDVLKMTVEECIEFFSNHPKIIKVLKTIDNVWLWYIKLWQSSTTLSGWEAQRVKLSTELSKRSTGKTFYILDEPTTGLHFQDVDRLLKILHSLVDSWNSVLVIEHNMDVIVNADYIIDMWPEWGDRWWQLVAQWTVDEIAKNKDSFTGEAIRDYMSKFE